MPTVLMKRDSENQMLTTNVERPPELKRSKSSDKSVVHTSMVQAAPVLERSKSSTSSTSKVNANVNVNAVASIIDAQGNANAASAIIAKVQAYVDSGALTGCNVRVFGRDDVKVSGTFGNHASDDLYPLYSLTKSFTGLAVLQLIEKGMISLDEPVATYLPSFAQERRKGAEGFSVDPQSVTVRHCLTHTAGFTYFIDTVHPHRLMSANEAAEVEHFVAAFAKTFTETPQDSLGWAEEYQANAALVFEPGTHFNYSEGSNVLAAIVEKVTGMHFSRYLEEEIVRPVGAEGIAYVCADYDRMPTCRIASKYEDELGKFLNERHQLDMQPTLAHSRGDSGLKGTAEDLVRYGQMLLRGGKAADGTVVLGEKAFELATTNLLGEKTLEPPFSYGAPTRALDAPGHFGATKEESEVGRSANFFPGHGWSGFGGVVLDPKRSGLPETAKGVVWWQGLSSTYIAVNPSSGVGVVLTACEIFSGDHQAFFGELIGDAHKV